MVHDQHSTTNIVHFDHPSQKAEGAGDGPAEVVSDEPDLRDMLRGSVARHPKCMAAVGHQCSAVAPAGLDVPTGPVGCVVEIRQCSAFL